MARVSSGDDNEDRRRLKEKLKVTHHNSICHFPWAENFGDLHWYLKLALM